MFNFKAVKILNLQLDLKKEKDKLIEREKFIEKQNEMISVLDLENRDLKEVKENTERRCLEYARELKELEDIMKGEGNIVSKYDKINDVLFGKHSTPKH